ncbi:ribonuclease J [Oscillospiraceae bacterium PP1C4]
MPKNDVPNATEPAKPETSKPESPKPNPPRSNPPRPKPPKPKPAKTDTAKPDFAKVEAPKQEPAKQPGQQPTKQPGQQRGRRPKSQNQQVPQAQISVAKTEQADAKQQQNNNQNRNKKNRQSKEQRKTPVKIIPLGGLNEVGKNLTVCECQNDMFLIDCGMTFPDEQMLGVDLVLPDFTYVNKNRDKLRGIVITHGHEDHIGALPFFLKQVNVPVYGTKLTLGLIENKLREHGLYGKVKLMQIAPREMVKLGCMEVEFIRVNHSIPDAVALAIHTPAGVLIHTGDFKIDYTPIIGGIIDLARFGELGSHGVLALFADSTNAERPGFTPTERTVGESFDKLFKQAKDKRIIVATFSSNVHRVQLICEAAAKNGRKVAVSGRSMVNVVAIAIELGYLTPPKGVMIDIDDINRFPPEQITIITTGSQGEPMSALSRMAGNDHRKVSVSANDFIIISATPIPGNEKTVGRVVNELMRLGADVIWEKMYEVHVSGHACQEELKIMLALTRPKFFFPVHGEYKHLKRHASLALAMGMDSDHVFIGENGKVFELDGVSVKCEETVPSGRVLVDGLGVGDVGSIVLRDRKHLGQDGLIIVVTTIESATGEIVAGPDIISRGFVYVREAEVMLTEARDIARKTLEECSKNNVREWGNIKTQVRDALSSYFYGRTKRSPMILPVIQEI